MRPNPELHALFDSHGGLGEQLQGIRPAIDAIDALRETRKLMVDRGGDAD